MTKRNTKGTPDPIDIHVGQQLKAARKSLEISQAKAAKEIGITFQQLQKYEAGVNRVAAGRLAKFSKLYQMPISWFFPDEYAEIGAKEIKRLEKRVSNLESCLETIKGIAEAVT